MQNMFMESEWPQHTLDFPDVTILLLLLTLSPSARGLRAER